MGNGLVTNKTKQKTRKKERKKTLEKRNNIIFSQARKELSINSENIKYLENIIYDGHNSTLKEL